MKYDSKEVKMNNYSFNFRIEGGNVSPNTMSFFELAPFLNAFCSAIESEGRKAGIELADLDESLNLVKIGEGSVLLEYMGRSESIMKILATVVAAFTIAHAEIPTKQTIEFVKSTADLSKRYDYVISCNSQYLSNKPIRLTDKSYQVPKYEVKKINESTWLYGTLVSIGGKTASTAHIVGLDGNVVNCLLSKELAQQMANQLYGKMLHLTGEATFTYKDKWILDEFTIKSYSIMKSTRIVDAVKAIKPYLVEKYNSIDDVDEHILAMRK
jgi:hypothetical protein